MGYSTCSQRLQCVKTSFNIFQIKSEFKTNSVQAEKEKEICVALGHVIIRI